MPRKKKTTKSTGKDMVNWEDQMRADISAKVAREKTTGNFISTKGGRFQVGGSVLKPPLNVIVMNYIYDNARFEQDFDPDSMQPPVCFALAMEEQELKPHKDSPQPQSPTCKECEWNKFGSGKRENSKGCRNYRRLAVLAADEVAQNPEVAELKMIKIPPSAIPNWKGYLRELDKLHGRDTYGVVTSIDFLPDADVATVGVFEVVEMINDPNALSSFHRRIKGGEVEELLNLPYDVSNYGVKPTKHKGPARRKVKAKTKVKTKTKATRGRGRG